MDDDGVDDDGPLLGNGSAGGGGARGQGGGGQSYAVCGVLQIADEYFGIYVSAGSAATRATVVFDAKVRRRKGGGGIKYV
jgi:hypothetical protein